MHSKLTILYQDLRAVVIAKPSGMPSTGPTPDAAGSVEHALRAQLGRPVWAVHQLDQDTSGTNLFALRRSAVEPLAAALKSGRKTYVALCHGAPPRGSFEVDLPIGRWDEPGSPRSFPAVAPLSPDLRDPKPALTRFETLAVAADGRAGLVLCRPATGRTHQIRLHLAALGHPLVGERLHAPVLPPAAPRHLLHALSLELPGFSAVAPVPTDLQDAVARLADPALLAALRALPVVPPALGPGLEAGLGANLNRQG